MRMLAPLNRKSDLISSISKFNDLADVSRRMSALPFDQRIVIVGEFLINTERELLRLKGIGEQSLERIRKFFGDDLTIGQWQLGTLSDDLKREFIVAGRPNIMVGRTGKDRSEAMRYMIEDRYATDASVMGALGKPISGHVHKRDFYY